jgi:hypothetical protein
MHSAAAAASDGTAACRACIRCHPSPLIVAIVLGSGGDDDTLQRER